jgi:EAL domain-containing protein (putative c-di-GMP-specific phosphodiesterase class I)
MRPITSHPEVPWAAPKPKRAPAALAPAALEIHYQPVVEVATGHVTGAEALLRRRMPSGVVQIAARFLPLAEATGLLVEIGRRVVDKACGVAAEWQVFQRGTSVTVNISARQLEDPALPGWVEAVLARHALRAELLILDIPEITVAAAALDGGPGLQHMHQLADLGVRIAVDDVGTGPGAPTYLPSVPVSILKIDGRFVRALGDDGDAKLVPAMIALAKEMGVTSIAEGVETEEQLAALTELGCDQAQGYLFGRPTSPDRVAQQLRY